MSLLLRRAANSNVAPPVAEEEPRRGIYGGGFAYRPSERDVRRLAALLFGKKRKKKAIAATEAVADAIAAGAAEILAGNGLVASGGLAKAEAITALRPLVEIEADGTAPTEAQIRDAIFAYLVRVAEIARQQDEDEVIALLLAA